MLTHLLSVFLQEHVVTNTRHAQVCFPAFAVDRETLSRDGIKSLLSAVTSGTSSKSSTIAIRHLN
jgi:hypothetical protein